MSSGPRGVPFEKYSRMGAYHWRQCDPRSKDFSPPVLARYALTIAEVERLAVGGRVLDLGAGDCYLVSRVAPSVDAAVGVEYDPHGLAAAGPFLEGAVGLLAVRGSAYRVPVRSSSFDVVVMGDVVEHLEDPRAALAEAKRVLRPGGSLVLTTPRFRPDRVWDERHEKEYRVDELEELLRSVFSDVRLRFFWPLFWSRCYANPVGWKLIRWVARRGWNPFMRPLSDRADGFGQMLAVARP